MSILFSSLTHSVALFIFLHILFCVKQMKTLFARTYICIIFYGVHLLEHFICLDLVSIDYELSCTHSMFSYTHTRHHIIYIAINLEKVTNQCLRFVFIWCSLTRVQGDTETVGISAKSNNLFFLFVFPSHTL